MPGIVIEGRGLDVGVRVPVGIEGGRRVGRSGMTQGSTLGYNVEDGCPGWNWDPGGTELRKNPLILRGPAV